MEFVECIKRTRHVLLIGQGQISMIESIFLSKVEKNTLKPQKSCHTKKWLQTAQEDERDIVMMWYGQDMQK